MEKNSRIVTAAITGSIHIPTMSDYLPITPEQIAENALGAAEAGAAVVHIHARNPENGLPSSDLEVFDEIINRIRDKNKDVVICLTTGGGAGMTVDERAAIIPRFKPELASCNLGSINWGIFPAVEKIKEFKYPWESFVAEISRNAIFQNTFADLMKITSIMAENGTHPEFEVYDVGHLYNCAYLIQAGFIKPPIYLQFVTGILGGIMATPYDLMTLHTTADRILGAGNYIWSVIGAGRNEFPICTMGLLMGSSVRVGLEDNLFLGKGVKAKNNAELVSKMVRIMGEFDLKPATPAEVRETLQLKGVG
ncbi:MAG: 3-keto-5-aminohexanoate cleavage protein [Candidatus Saccharibacteria bacterium]